MISGGWGGIRTPGEREPTPVFKTGALNHSATHPSKKTNYLPNLVSGTNTELAPSCPRVVHDALRSRGSRFASRSSHRLLDRVDSLAVVALEQVSVGVEGDRGDLCPRRRLI